MTSQSCTPKCLIELTIILSICSVMSHQPAAPIFKDRTMFFISSVVTSGEKMLWVIGFPINLRGDIFWSGYLARLGPIFMKKSFNLLLIVELSVMNEPFRLKRECTWLFCSCSKCFEYQPGFLRHVCYFQDILNVFLINLLFNFLWYLSHSISFAVVLTIKLFILRFNSIYEQAC